MKETKIIEFASGLKYEAEFLDGVLTVITSISNSRRAIIEPKELPGLINWLSGLNKSQIIDNNFINNAEINDRKVIKQNPEEIKFSADTKIEDFSNKLPNGGYKVKVGGKG